MKKVNLGFGGGRLWQFENKSASQSMSYLIETPEKKYIMIDGGNAKNDDDADFLYDYLTKNNIHLSAWIFTHAHDDHIGAFIRIFEKYGGLPVDCLYFDFPPTEWFDTIENGSMAGYMKRWNAVFEKYKIPRKRLMPLNEIEIDGIKILPLNSAQNYKSYTSINDSSVALKVYFPKREILFLGDLHTEGEADLLKTSKDYLPCDIVQMAHHGQYGVSEEFYKIIKPKITLWPTPLWLWENDQYEGRPNEKGICGKNTGPFDTLNTRKWMAALNVFEYYPMFEGDTEFY